MDDFGRYFGLVLGCYVAGFFLLGAIFGAIFGAAVLWLLT